MLLYLTNVREEKMTKDRIIEATIRNFAEHGYQGASMRKIAEDVGIKPASIYHFFENKQKLFIEAIKVILNHHFSSMKETFEQYQSDSLHILFSELLNKITFHHTSNQEETKAYVLMVNSSIPDIKEEVRHYLETYDSWLVTQLMEIIVIRYPHLDTEEIKEIIDYFIFLGNGLFWGIIIYEKDDIQRNLKQATYLMNQYLIHRFGSDIDEGQKFN